LSRRRVLQGAAAGAGLALGLTGAGGRAGTRTNAQDAATPAGRSTGLTHKGISYDVGVDWPWASSRPTWNVEFVRHDLGVIRDELHCTAVSLFGTDPDRLIESAGIAQELGLDAWVQPRLPDGTPEATLEQLVALAQGAEEVRQTHPNVVLNAGCELSIFMSGIIPGATYLERLATLTTMLEDLEEVTAALNETLAGMVEAARAEFGGTITYGAGFWEDVDWSRFDVIGLNHYRTPFNAETYASDLEPYVAQDKPVVVTEFGCTTFEGAAEMGGAGFSIVDWTATPPQLNGDFVRSEEEQATEIVRLLDLIEGAGAEGAFLFTFIDPTYTYSPDPRFDLDMASFSVVKTFPADTGQGYDETGYWEPKQSFDALAERYQPA
jgi:hypothetical protein